MIILNRISSFAPLLWLISLISLIIRAKFVDVSQCGYVAICFPKHHAFTMYVFEVMIIGIIVYVSSCILLKIMKKRIPILNLILFIIPIGVMVFYYIMSNGFVFESYIWGAERRLPLILDTLGPYLKSGKAE